MFAAAFFHVLAHISINVFFSLYLDSLGYDKTTIGLMWVVSVLAEIGWFFTRGRWLPRLSLPGWLVLVGGVESVLDEVDEELNELVFAPPNGGVRFDVFLETDGVFEVLGEEPFCGAEDFFGAASIFGGGSAAVGEAAEVGDDIANAFEAVFDFDDGFGGVGSGAGDFAF